MLILNSKKLFNHTDLCFQTKWASRDFKIHRQNRIVLHLPMT